MIDARNVYRKVTRKIYDFSPEQLQNITSIVWLYRGQSDRFIELVHDYIDRTLNEANNCFLFEPEQEGQYEPLSDYMMALESLNGAMEPFLKSLGEQGVHAAPHSQLLTNIEVLQNDIAGFKRNRDDAWKYWNEYEYKQPSQLEDAVNHVIGPLAEQSRDLIKLMDLSFKSATRLVDLCEKELDAKKSDLWSNGDINGVRKTNLKKSADTARKLAVDRLKLVRYFYKQAHWLQSRFPEAELKDVEGLVKLVDMEALEANDWSLTPGRYVGVAPEEVDEDFDFEEALREIYNELAGLNEEAVQLAAQITINFEALGI